MIPVIKLIGILRFVRNRKINFLNTNSKIHSFFKTKINVFSHSTQHINIKEVKHEKQERNMKKVVWSIRKEYKTFGKHKFKRFKAFPR